ALSLEGNGVTLTNLQLAKGTGRGKGTAFVGWDGTYTFSFDGTAIPLDSITALRDTAYPVSGLIDFTAGGSGSFDNPRYDVHGTLRDFFVKDEGVGVVSGDLGVNGDLLTVRLEAASPRLQISGRGQVA